MKAAELNCVSTASTGLIPGGATAAIGTGTRTGRDHSYQQPMKFDKPQPAMIEAPPYEPEQYDVYALELNPEGYYPFKVWVKDGNPDEDKPFYASGVHFWRISRKWH